MANTITLKKSGVAGRVPTTGTLSLGEIALNYKDGYLFYRDDELSPAVHKINANNADNADTVDGFHLNQNVLTTSTPTFDKLRLTNGSDASLTSTDHAFQVGTSSGQNLIIDNNEIISRSNGSASILYLQNDGGDVRLGTNGGTSRLYVQDGVATAPAITFNNDSNTGIYRIEADHLGITTGGTLRAQFNNSGIVSSANVYSGTSGQFRNFAGVWKATTGATGNGFQFISPDATALTISSTGNATFAGSVTATSLIKSGGTSSQFLKADGSVDSSTYVSSSALSSYLPLAGGTITGNINLNDDVKVRFGNAQDLELYHSSAGDSYIVNKTGVLDIRNTVHGGDIKLQAENSSGTLEEYFRIDGGLGYSVASQHLRMADGKALYAGEGNDLGIYHVSGNSYIQNLTGELIIQNDANDNDIVFKSDNGSGGVTDYLRLDGSHTQMLATKNLHFDDNVELRFGDYASPDLKIYHDGSNSFIKDTGTGSLYIDGSQNVFIRDTNGQVWFQGNAGGVNLRYQDSVKIQTTSSGVSVTGSMLANAAVVNQITAATSSGSIKFKNNAGSDKAIILDNGNFGIGTNSPTRKLTIQGGWDEYIRYGHTSEGSNGRGIGVDSNGFYGTTFYKNGTPVAKISDTGGLGLGLTYSASSGIAPPTGGAIIEGKVGIGITSPDSKLHVASGDVLISNNQFYAAESTLGTNYKLAGLTSGNVIQVGAIDYTSASTVFAGGNNVSVTTGGAAGTSRLYINSSGNVGIGTTSPSYKLDVAGEGKVTGKFRVGGAVMLAEPGTGVLLFGSEGGSQTAIYSASAERIRINASGNVGIGDTTPSYKLDVNGTLRTTSAAYFNNDIIVTNNATVSGDLTVSTDFEAGAAVNFSALANAGSDVDKFLVSDSGDVKFRTGAEVLSDIGGQASISAPNAPASASVAIVGETVEVTFAESTTSNIDAYLVYSSIDGSDYGLISIVPPDDFAASMSIIDNAFDETGTQAYRVYAMKYGILSSAASDSVSYSVSSAEPTSMSVVNLNNAYYVQWNPPSSNARFVTAYNVYKHEHATQGSLSRGSASLVYSGTNTNYMYQISGTNNNNFHQFWVETTIA